MESDAALAAGRRIEWARQTLTQGEILEAFGRHCRGDLDDVEVVEAAPWLLEARWRSETSRIELRADLAGCLRPLPAVPTMLLGDLGPHLDTLAEAFASDAVLRSRVTICDLERLEKIGAVRSTVFVYFEWFLRDTYGVKLLPASAFTQRLIDRGIIHLGMG